MKQVSRLERGPSATLLSGIIIGAVAAVVAIVVGITLPIICIRRRKLRYGLV